MPKPKPPATNKYAPIFIPFCVQMGIPRPEAEYAFCPGRRFRMDFAWPDHRVGLEIQGGVWINGGHSRGSGMLRDIEKSNEACALHWRVLKATPQTLYTLSLVQIIKHSLTPIP